MDDIQVDAGGVVALGASEDSSATVVVGKEAVPAGGSVVACAAVVVEEEVACADVVMDEEAVPEGDSAVVSMAVVVEASLVPHTCASLRDKGPSRFISVPSSATSNSCPLRFPKVAFSSAFLASVLGFELEG